MPQDSVTINNLFNPYAAVPSMHVAFALMIGIPLSRLVKWRALKVFWATYPLLVVFVIVATANHFIADAVLGAAAAGIGALAARALARTRPRVWTFQPRAPRRRRAVQRRPPRPDGGRHAAASADRARTRPSAASARRAPSAASVYRNRLIESRLTPNAISLTGFALNVLAAVLVWQTEFFWGGVAFIVGSIMDTLDGAYSRMSGKGTPFGAFLDSTLDRIEEGIVLTARRRLVRQASRTRPPSRPSSSPCSRRSSCPTPARAPRRSASSARSASRRARSAS